MDDTQRSLGLIEGTLKAHAETHTRMESALAAQGTKLDTIVGYIERDKGARRAVGVIATLLGGAAGFVASIFGSK